jgi:hypothetical protein
MRLRPCPCGRAVRGLTEEGGVCIYLSLVPRGKVFTAHGNASMSAPFCVAQEEGARAGAGARASCK